MKNMKGQKLRGNLFCFVLFCFSYERTYLQYKNANTPDSHGKEYITRLVIKENKDNNLIYICLDFFF